ncbi:MAG: glycosyltransferase [Actinomycetota bacterium]|nr:glycosyltransferase [Actinomycetota bacterium]
MENGTRVIGGKEGRRIWPLLLLAGTVFLFFRQLLLLRKVPWISDIRNYYLPNWKYLSGLLRSGDFSFWCSGIYCGFPLFADSEMALFYPLTPPFMLLPSTAGFNYFLVLHYLLGGCFLYLYCRLLRLGRSASCFAAAPFMLSGFFLAHLVHPNVVATLAWIPLFLYLLERALQENRFSFHLLAGGVLGLQFLSGFLMIPLIEVLLSFFYVFLHPEASQRSSRMAALARWGGSVALGLGLGMIQNLPSYHLVNSSYRAGGLSSSLSNVGNLPVLQLAGVFFPRAFGRGLAQSGYLGAWTFEETYIYAGILPLLFAPAALRKPRRWPAPFLFWAGVVALLLSLGNQGLLWPVLRHLPGFHVLKGPGRFFLITNLCLLVLGAMGFDRWRGEELEPDQLHGILRGWTVFATASAALLALFVLLYRTDVLHFRDFAAAVSGPFLSGIKISASQVLDGLAAYFTSPHVELLIPVGLLVLFLFLLKYPWRGVNGRRTVAALVVILAVLDVFYVAGLVFKPIPRNRADYRPPVLDVLEEDSAGGRVALLGEPGVKRGEFSLAPNQLLPYGLEDAFGFSTIPPARVDRFLGLLQVEPRDRALALAGVKVLLSNLVRVRGTAYDLGSPFTFPSWMGSVDYAVDPSVKGRELRLLLDGPILDPESLGTVHLKLQARRGGRLQDLPLLVLEKDTGEEDYFLSVMYDQGPVNFQRVRFRSPGFGDGREALEIRIPLRLRHTDRLSVFSLCSEGLRGSRLAAVSLVDEDGRSVPLLPWAPVYSDGRYAVYRVGDPAPQAFTAWEVRWVDDWKAAVDLAFWEGYREGEVILSRAEVDPATRRRIENISRPEGETRVEVLERGGDGLLLRTSGTGDTVLVLNQDYLPGWKAFLDGEERPLFSAYGFLTALYLPAGEHRVSLRYRSPGLLAGGVISLLSLAAFLGLLVLSLRRERARERAKESEKTSLPPPDSGGISAFFPCYNDSATIGEVVEKALRVLRELTDDYEVIIVDDGSSDASGVVIDSVAAAHPEVRVVRHDRNRGYGAALRSGIKISSKNWIFYTDSDGQYDVEELRKLHALTGVADVVNGYKESRSDPWYRVVLGGIYNRVVRRLFLVPIRDVDCDFRLMRGDLARSLDLRSEGGSICVELVKGLQAAGAVFAEVPVRHLPRREGKSQFFRLRNLLAMVRGDVSLWIRLWRKGEI